MDDKLIKRKNKKGNSRFELANKINIFPDSKRSNSRFELANKINIFPSSNRSNSRFELANKINIFPSSNRSQVTIFIILAFILVVLIAIIFLLKLRGNVIMQVIDENNPQGSIETCTKQAIEDALERITVNGGDINPGFSVQYKNDNIVYICYSGEYYKQCSYQRPLLVEHIQREIEEYITPKVEDCFEKLKFRLRESSTDVRDSPGVNVQIRLFPKHIGIRIEKDFHITRGENTISFNNFKLTMLHPIYDFADIAMEAGNQQAKYCYFDSLGYMILHPSFNIEETITTDYDKIYVITERATNHKYQFAARSCPLPPGY